MSRTSRQTNLNAPLRYKAQSLLESLLVILMYSLNIFPRSDLRTKYMVVNQVIPPPTSAEITETANISIIALEREE